MNNENKFQLYSFLSLFLLLGAGMFLYFRTPHVQAAGGPSPCIKDPVDFKVEKMLLPLPSECGYKTKAGKPYCGRGGFTEGAYAPAPDCVKPTHIVMHTTLGLRTALATFRYFQQGGGGRGVGSHFAVGNDGAMLQMVEMGATEVEYAQTVGPFDPHISIEMGSRANFDSKQHMISENSQAQYDNTLKLVKTLMAQYNIPIENVISHKSKGGPAGDPGDGWMKDFLKDLPNASPLSGVSPVGGGSGSSGGSSTSTSCVITKVGDPATSPPPLPPACTSGGGGGGMPGVCGTAPPPPADIRTAINEKWGINLELPQKQLELAWEEFHEIDCTGFLQDIRGTYVASWGNNYAQQFSCPGQGVNVRFSNQWTGEFMKTILTHELVHVWQFCSKRGEANRLEIPPVYSAEGGLTNYSRTGCGFGVNLHNEDHADTIALYLNDHQNELTCGNGAENPFKGGRFPLHRGVAEKGVGKQ